MCIQTNLQYLCAHMFAVQLRIQGVSRNGSKILKNKKNAIFACSFHNYFFCMTGILRFVKALFRTLIKAIILINPLISGDRQSGHETIGVLRAGSTLQLLDFERAASCN